MIILEVSILRIGDVPVFREVYHYLAERGYRVYNLLTTYYRPLVNALWKIDVEGAEWDLLKGAENILKSRKPILFLSLHPEALAKRGVSTESIISWLREFGYKVEIISQDHEIHVIVK